MSYDYNEKGKIFTEVINKSAVKATIQTVTNLIEGVIHIRRDKRVKDELDEGERFLAVTDAKIYAADGSLSYQAKFLSVAREQIVWVIPGEIVEE